MKVLSGFFIAIAAVSIILGGVLRLIPARFPLGGGIPPQSFLEFSAVCLLLALTISVFSIANKSS